MDTMDLESRIAYEHPPTHPFYEETSWDNALVAISAIVLVIGFLVAGV